MPFCSEMQQLFKSKHATIKALEKELKVQGKFFVERDDSGCSRNGIWPGKL